MSKSPMQQYHEQVEREQKEMQERYKEAETMPYGMLQLSPRTYLVVKREIGHYVGEDKVPLIRYTRVYNKMQYEEAYNVVVKLNRKEREKRNAEKKP